MAISAQDAKVTPEKAKVEAAKPTPLTDKEKSDLKDLQLKLAGIQRMIEVILPKQLTTVQEEINKMGAELQKKHNAPNMALDANLEWVKQN